VEEEVVLALVEEIIVLKEEEEAVQLEEEKEEERKEEEAEVAQIIGDPIPLLGEDQEVVATMPVQNKMIPLGGKHFRVHSRMSKEEGRTEGQKYVLSKQCNQPINYHLSPRRKRN